MPRGRTPVCSQCCPIQCWLQECHELCPAWVIKSHQLPLVCTEWAWFPPPHFPRALVFRLRQGLSLKLCLKNVREEGDMREHKCKGKKLTCPAMGQRSFRRIPWGLLSADCGVDLVGLGRRRERVARVQIFHLSRSFFLLGRILKWAGLCTCEWLFCLCLWIF